MSTFSDPANGGKGRCGTENADQSNEDGDETLMWGYFRNGRQAPRFHAHRRFDVAAIIVMGSATREEAFRPSNENDAGERDDCGAELGTSKWLFERRNNGTCVAGDNGGEEGDDGSVAEVEVG